MDVDGVDMCWMLGTRKYYINMYQTLTNGSDMQVATKEILRFEALWLKHFKDTRGDVLKERRCMLLPHVLILGWRLCCCLISVASECLDLTMWNTGSFQATCFHDGQMGEAKCRLFMQHAGDQDLSKFQKLYRYTGDVIIKSSSSVLFSRSYCSSYWLLAC